MPLLVKPILPLRRRIPKTFLVVVLLFLFWAATMALVVAAPGALNTLFLLAQTIAGWLFVIVIAIVGALLLGMFISHRLITHGGFTPFEEEMMRMRKDVQQQLTHTEKMREEVSLLRLEVARLKRSAQGGSERDEGAAVAVPSSRRGTQAELAMGASASGGEGPEGLEELGR